MSIRDAARASGLSPKALRRRIERGTLGSVLVGGRRRIPVDDLVRRGLVPGVADAATGESATAGEQAAIVRRLRALESRVAALEAAIDVAGTPVAIGGRSPAPLLASDSRAGVTADAARPTASSPH